MWHHERRQKVRTSSSWSVERSTDDAEVVDDENSVDVASSRRSVPGRPPLRSACNVTLLGHEPWTSVDGIIVSPGSMSMGSHSRVPEAAVVWQRADH